MNITKNITKTTFAITLESLRKNYMTNMLEWLQNYSKTDFEASIEELALFSINSKELARRNIDAIKRLFDNGSTFMLLSKEDFDVIEQAEIDKEKWEILVEDKFGKEIVRIQGEDVGWQLLSAEREINTMKYLTVSVINRAIKHLGLEIIRGNGYSYFLDLKTGEQVGESVYVCYLSNLSLEGWIKEAQERI